MAKRKVKHEVYSEQLDCYITIPEGLQVSVELCKKLRFIQREIAFLLPSMDDEETFQDVLAYQPYLQEFHDQWPHKIQELRNLFHPVLKFIEELGIGLDDYVLTDTAVGKMGQWLGAPKEEPEAATRDELPETTTSIN
jgi:hypothetical protein